MADTDPSTPTRRSLLRGGATAGALALAGAALPGTAGARGTGRCRLNWGEELAARRCDGDLVVNVTQAVVNDIDSGYHGYWAYDDYRRHLQAWQVGEDEYCAVVAYRGTFDAVEGQLSPGTGDDGGEPLSGDERGRLLGGYAATIEGPFLDDPAWPTRGFVGTFDYEGDVQAGTRPGAVRWDYQYFDQTDPAFAFSFDWWGWIYRGGRYGTWVNAVSEPGHSCGDIHD